MIIYYFLFLFFFWRWGVQLLTDSLANQVFSQQARKLFGALSKKVTCNQSHTEEARAGAMKSMEHRIPCWSSG